MKDTRGVTLIALIVTIIVLLILAGIAINGLTGEKGIINEAKTAKQETEVAEIIEKAQIEIIRLDGKTDGDITEDKVNEIIAQYDKEKKIRDDKEEKYIITEKGYEIKVSDIWNGTSIEENPTLPTFNPDTLTIGADAQNTDKYGWKVGNYTVKTSEMSTNVWRLFYQDSKYTYIITDDYVGMHKPDGLGTKYPDGASVSMVGRRLNSMVSSLFTSEVSDYRVEVMAWMTDVSEQAPWTSYKNSDAVFAIGSPTIELFAASFNQKKAQDSRLKFSADSKGYSWDVATHTFIVGENHGIYNKSGSVTWPLASPGAYNVKVREVGGDFYDGEVWSTRYEENPVEKFRPIVCIPTSVFNSKYLTSLVDI